MTKSKQPMASAKPDSAVNYAYKPLVVGKIIEALADKQRMTPRELGQRVGVNHRNIYRLFKSRTMNMPMLFKMSEALCENLLLHYHPNVKPLPNPLQAENEQLKAENAQLKQSLAQLQSAAEENKILKAQLDVLREVMKAK